MTEFGATKGLFQQEVSLPCPRDFCIPNLPPPKVLCSQGIGAVEASALKFIMNASNTGYTDTFVSIDLIKGHSRPNGSVIVAKHF